MKHSHTVLPKTTLLQKIAASIAMLAVVMLSVPPQAYAQVSTDTAPVETPTPIETPTPTVDPEVVPTSVGDPAPEIIESTDPGPSDNPAPTSFSIESKQVAPDESNDDTPPTPGGQCILHSDTTDVVVPAYTPAVAVSPIHSAWTAIINLATWIWTQNPIADAENATSGIFVKKFYLTSIPTSGTLEIAADNSYSVTLNDIPLTSDGSEDNYSAAGKDTVTVPVNDLVLGENTLVFTVHNFAQVGGTMATNPAGLLYTFTLEGADCTTAPPHPAPKPITVVATKVVCTDESQLPNWGNGENGPITSTTATDWVNDPKHNTCHLQSDWQFEWANGTAADAGGAFTGPAGGAYTTFGPTNGSGVATVQIPSAGVTNLTMREVLKPGYIPFTFDSNHPQNDNNVSAEFYCSTDVLNYDNLDYVRNPQAGGTYYCVGFNAPAKTETHTSTVTMCKADDQQHPLSGWTLMLKGAHVGTVAVKPDGTDYTVSSTTVPAGNYVVTANGAYIYRPGDVTASTSDAAFSLRAAGEGYTGPYAPWILENSFPMPYTGWLGVMANHATTNWGTTYHPDHTYALNLSLLAPQNLTFTILDDQYGDNSGSIEVNVDHGYEGVTNEGGCTTFNNVPYGTYTAAELNQPGWTNVTGLGTVEVAASEQTITVVNHHVVKDSNEGPATISATKVVCTDPAEMPHWGSPDQSGPDVTPTTATDWVTNHKSCHLQSGWQFEWGPNGSGDQGNTTVGPAGHGYTTFGPTGLDGVATTSVNVSSTTVRLELREVLKDGYVPFTNDGPSAEFYCESDVYLYDNIEVINNPVAGKTYYCVAFNKLARDGNPGGNEDTTSAHTTVVSGNTAAGENMLGWLFNRDTSTQSPYAFNTTTPDIGTGSLFVQPITNTINGALDKFVGELYLLTPISGVKSISYDFNIGSPDAAAKSQFYMNVYANFGESTSTKYYDCRYDVVPTSGTVGGYTTVTFDPTQSYPVTQRSTSPHTCPSSPAGMDALDIGTSTIRAIALNVGDTSSSDTGVSGYFDKVVTVIKSGTDTHTETYDFEPTAVTPTDNNPGGNNGGSGSSTGGGGSRSSKSKGSVLGVSTTTEPIGQVLGASCGILLPNYLKIGWANNLTEVKDLQTFLNAELPASLPVTGFFGSLTEKAVRLFQAKYGPDVLKPWVGLPASGITNPEDTTGFVYKSTQWKINMIHCPELNLPFPTLD